jgi:3-oxoacyl-(acyl-carrier-protein) synthase
MLQPDESGRSIVELIDAALRSAGLSTRDIDFVSAHGTSTPVNDRTEARALRARFGTRCDDLPVTAVKSMTGHAIAASGGMEIAAAALSLRHGELTPTINYEEPDPDCPVDVVANRPRRVQAETCLKLSYGFGGHNACVVLGRA